MPSHERKDLTSADWATPWRPSLGYGELSRFASTAALIEIGLDQHDQTDRLQHHGPAAVLADLFRQMSDRGWSYNLKPWHASTGQLIRDPVSITRGSATCLDLSLLMCAMAKQSGLRPYLAIARSRIPSKVPDHAFVVIDAGASALDRQTKAAWNATGAVGSRYHSGDAPFWGSAILGRDPFDVPPAWLAIDPTHACRRHGQDVNVAVTAALTMFQRSVEYNSIDLIDIVGAHQAGFEELPANADAVRPVLFGTIPALDNYVDLARRRQLVEQLGEANGYVILAGDPGSGKSVTANLIAGRAGGGSGWLLQADDPATFKVSLAESAMNQLGMDPAGLEGNNVEPFAQAAFETLRTADSRWVVVLDNADSPPAAYGRLPVPKANQLVLVTTNAREAWATWAAARPGAALMVDLPALTSSEAGAWVVDGQEIADLPATPLLIKLAVRLHQAGRLGAGRTTLDLVGDALRDLPASSVEAARSLAWLPPVAVPRHVLCEEWEQATAQLIDLGLVEPVEGGDVLMHRSIREATRQLLADPGADAAAIASLLADPDARRSFEAAATLPELVAMAEAIGGGHLPDRQRAHCLYRLGTFQERKNSKASAAWFNEVLTILGPTGKDADAADAAIICGCLQGIARSAFRNDPDDTWGQVLERMTDVSRLAAIHPDDLAVQVAASRAEAMVGILRGRLATTKFIPDDGARRAEQLAALALVEHSAERRAQLVDPGSPDVDRSRFNLPGNLIGLAKDAPTRSEAINHLHRARDIYDELYRLRADRYRTDHLEEVITCLHGSAVTRYLEAVLDDAMPGPDRLHLLARAHDDAARAMRVREGLSDGLGVTTDSLKSSALAAKSLLLVTAIGNSLGVRPNDALISSVLDDSADDAARVASSIWAAPTTSETVMPPLASKADARAFVEYLLSRPELWAVVDAFGDGPSGLRQRRRDLARLIDAGAFGDSAVPAEDAANAQAGRVLARWVSAPSRGASSIPGDIAGQVRWLGALAGRWDMRAGRLRDRIPTTAEMFDPAVQSAINDLARAWQMIEPAPATGAFDHAIVLGGLMRANVNRPAAAAALITSGSIATPSVIGLAGGRPLEPSEIELAGLLGCEATDEEGSLRWGLAQAFAGAGAHWETGTAANLQRMDAGGPVDVQLAVAPASTDGRTPTTGAAFDWLVSSDSRLVHPGSRILSVTTAIYWIDGHIRLLMQMPQGAELVTTGSAPRIADPADPLAQVFLSQHYLQEIKSAIDALPGLLAWAAA